MHSNGKMTIGNNVIKSNKEEGIRCTSTTTNTALVDNIVQYNNKGILTESTCNTIMVYSNTCTNNVVSNYNVGGTNNKFETTYNK